MNCKLNLECPNRCCPNRTQCDDLALPWEIPYKRTSEGLVVKQYGCRYEWSAEGTYLGSPISFCPLPSGQYLALDGSYHESEMKDRVKQAWRNAGWEAAIANPNFIDTRVEDNEEIEIPF
jgi:hypothetical protein